VALPGMKSTSDFATNERPQNYREGILLLSPRNGASLFALTAAMKSESTNDPTFNWWEEPLQLYNYAVSADVTNVATTFPLVGGGLMLKPGDMLRVDASGEAVQVVTVPDDTHITVTRAVGPGGTAAGTAAAIVAATNAKLLYVGSAYREGAPRSIGVSFNPTQQSNVTQIFRDPVEITRTATQTTFRTGDPFKNDKRRALNKHSVGIERAFWLGTRYETLESGQPKRFTDGLLNRIPAGNIVTVSGGVMDMDEFESYLAGMFAFGSGEKLAWGSIATMVKLGALVRKNSLYQWGPNETEYGMQVKRLFSPAGTLVLTEHPLFGQAGQFLANDLVIMDTAMMTYRYMQDTVFLPNREDNGTDGQCSEYLTECGLEIHHGNTFFWLRGINSVAKDAA
jgi:hypothetical protein